MIGTSAQYNPASLKETVAVALIEGVHSDVRHVADELAETMHRVRQFADAFLGSRPTPLPGAVGASKSDAPPRRGEALVNAVEYLKQINRDLNEEVARLNGI